MKYFKSFIVILVILFASSAAFAGNLLPPGPPEEGSGMCTLDELYDYLVFGIYPGPYTGFREPDDSPGSTGKTLQEILDDTATEFMKCNAKPEHVLDKVRFFSTSPGEPTDDRVAQWGVQQGTIPTRTLSADSTILEAGYYEATDLASVDTDLNADNIKSSVAIFGVQGVPAKELSSDSTEVEAGFYEATTLDAIDTDLSSSKIKGGVNIFGVQGSHWCPGCASCCPACPACDSCCPGCPACDSCCPGSATAGDVLTGTTFSSAAAGVGIIGTRPPAPVGRTGQTSTVPIIAPVGSDGDLQKGVVRPSPRFTNNSDGTVTDKYTGLIWLKNADCFGNCNWETAITYANGLASGQCGLTDGSVAGDWRLPNRFEFESLLDLRWANSALSNAAGTGQWTDGDAFVDVRPVPYWSSTTFALDTNYAWYVDPGNGMASCYPKASDLFVWPVRGGQ